MPAPKAMPASSTKPKNDPTMMGTMCVLPLLRWFRSRGPMKTSYRGALASRADTFNLHRLYTQ